MSGGVDSAVSAYLLKNQGYSVFALFMKNWEEEDCPAQKDFEDVTQVCDKLQIPYYVVNFTKNYWEDVFSHFLEQLALGVTPNPDTLCNNKIKFHHLLQKAKDLGADYLATGHYCQTDEGKLFRGKDLEKDQSYFLHGVHKSALLSTLFPVGGYQKAQVRKIAKDAKIPVFDKKDSVGICFIGKRKFTPFLQRHLQQNPGPIITVEGLVVGQHIGLPFYTIGQRKGLKIGGPGQAYFVVDKDINTNTLVVAQGPNHERLYSSFLIAKNPNWIETPPASQSCTAKIRYRQQDTPCSFEILQGKVHVTFAKPQRAVTPGQSVVFYQGARCLGGAIIERRLPKEPR